MRYLRDAWYVAGYADELLAGTLLARMLLEQPLVFFRDPQGRPTALLDRCPHRFAPLSAGKLIDGGAAVECPYHGLRFNAEGRCVLNPHGDGSIPKAAQVPAYAVRERDGLIWWWAGDAGAADDQLIPDYNHVTSGPEHTTTRGHLLGDCDYQLLVDNILDLTHADYLHPDSLGSGALTRAQAEVEDLGPRAVRITWRSEGDVAPPMFDRQLKQPGVPTDQWTQVTWTAPSNMLLELGATPQGAPRSDGVETYSLHLATPEAAGRTHYWYWGTRNFADNPHANAAIKQVIEHAFTQQDKPILEAQQRRIGGADFWSLKPVLLPSDAGAVRVRRKLDSLRGDAERSSSVSE